MAPRWFGRQGRQTAVGEVLKLMVRALFATTAIELPLAVLLFGVRERRGLAVVVLAQVATNPVVEFVCLSVCWRPELPLLSWQWATMLLVEVAAMVAEAVLYRATAVSRHPWCMSCALNAVSFVAGLLIA